MSSTEDAASNGEETNYVGSGQANLKGGMSFQEKEYETSLWDLLRAKNLSNASNTNSTNNDNANASACAAANGTCTTANATSSSRISGSKNGSNHRFGKETVVKKQSGKQQTLITSYSSSSSLTNSRGKKSQDVIVATPTTSRRTSEGDEGTATVSSRRSPLVAKVYGSQSDEGWHYRITLPSSVKPSDIVNVRLPLPLGSERIVSVICPPNIPPAKHNKRRSLLLVVLPKVVKQSDDQSVIDLTSENDKTDDEVRVPGNQGEAIDYQFEWKDMDSDSSSCDEKSENPSHISSANDIGKPPTQPIITPLKNSKVKSSTVTSPSTYMEMAHFAMANLKDRNGSSIPSLLKYITTNFSHTLDGKKNIKFHLTNALKVSIQREKKLHGLSFDCSRFTCIMYAV